MNKINIRNKKAFFNYEIVDAEVAGIILLGTEVKSIILGNVSFTDSYCDFIDNELWLINLHISEYKQASAETHDPKRNRKLLLTKQQLRKFQKKFDEKGLTIVPLNLFTDKRGLVKVEIGLARGKKQYDKKENIKERDLDRETAKILKNY